MINGINPAATPGTSYRWNHTGRFSNNNSVIKGKTDDPAATLTISPEGMKELREKLRELREPKVHTMDSYRRMLEGEKRIKAVYLKILDEEEARLLEIQALDPFNNSSGLYDDSYAFYEEDVTSYVERNLTGKVRNVSLIAKELERLVHGDDGRGTDRFTYPGETSSEVFIERAKNRELALQHAEYLAKTYFSDAEEGEAFVAGIRGYIEKNVWENKDYDVYDNSNKAPRKSGACALIGDVDANGNLRALNLMVYGFVHYEKYAKENNIDIVDFDNWNDRGDVFHTVRATREGNEAFERAYRKNRARWDAEAIMESKAQESMVDDSISIAKATLTQKEVDDSLQRLLSLMDS